VSASDELRPGDDVLVRQACGGDLAAFDALVLRHYGMCLRFAWRQLGNRADAEEVVQDAFLRAHRNVRRCRDPARFRAWLMAIVVNRCRSYAAREHRWLGFLERWQNQHGPDAGIVAAGAGETDVDPQVRHALATLTPSLREAILLRYVEQLSYQEMANITGAGVSALKMRVKRAAALLASLLERSHD
jgi:RNA polymerase sigma-70 factor (ECF subfamily)